MKYYLSIKSHADYPDWEDECWAASKKQAVSKFWRKCYKEFDLETIAENTVSQVDIERKTW